MTDDDEATAIDLTPMLDVVFIMLIFFIVSAVFIRVPGVEVERPPAATARMPTTSVLVAISSANEIWIDGRVVDAGTVRYDIERLHAGNPGGGLVIQADSLASNRYTLAVMDAAKAAGVAPVILATKRL